MIQKEIKKVSNPKKAHFLARFFKTGPGEYAEGDRFLGIVVPDSRKIAKKFSSEISDLNLKKLIQSKWHEQRLIGLLILTYRFPKASASEQKKIYQTYVRQMRFINNWDLVDVTAPKVVGAYLKDRKRTPLYQWARSPSLWKRRIAIISTFYFIQRKDLHDTYRISKRLLKDKEDLIHKATGWMLREAGKKDSRRLEKFLKDHHQKMPRTMLRYAIERFSKTKRKQYLSGKFK